MKTLKISLVATIAATLAWWLHLPQKMWPAHPMFADFLLALVLCIVLQVVWSDETKSQSGTKDAGTMPPK
jgi:uncharacterized membrane protein YadS